MTRYPVLDRLAGVTAPTLVIAGVRDPLVRVDRAHVFHDLAHVTAVQVTGAHHATTSASPAHRPPHRRPCRRASAGRAARFARHRRTSRHPPSRLTGDHVRARGPPTVPHQSHGNGTVEQHRAGEAHGVRCCGPSCVPRRSPTPSCHVPRLRRAGDAGAPAHARRRTGRIWQDPAAGELGGSCPSVDGVAVARGDGRRSDGAVNGVRRRPRATGTGLRPPRAQLARRAAVGDVVGALLGDSRDVLSTTPSSCSTTRTTSPTRPPPAAPRAARAAPAGVVARRDLRAPRSAPALRPPPWPWPAGRVALRRAALRARTKPRCWLAALSDDELETSVQRADGWVAPVSSSRRCQRPPGRRRALPTAAPDQRLRLARGAGRW